MRRISHVAVAVTLMFGSLVAGCSKTDDGKASPTAKTIEAEGGDPTPPRTPLGQAAKEIVETRDQMVAKMDAELSALDAKIGKLKRDLAARSAENKAEAESTFLIELDGQ